MVSHASVLVEAGSVALLTDPWLMGEVFNESWSLLCDASLSTTQLESVTHIWISHEHPDHLHFPTLKSIPPQLKKKITLLYQRHFSPRIVEALEKLGFGEVVELPLGRWFSLDKDVSVLCQSVGTIDSLLAIRSKTSTVLNMNDCMLNRTAAQRLAKRIGPVDLLLTQFSIANWAGNPNDTEIRDREAVLNRARLYIRSFKPRFTVPFASFIYFSHQENRHMNKWINLPDIVAERLSDMPTKVQFLYNGDSWSSENGFCVRVDPLERYQAEFESIPGRTYRSHDSYAVDDLIPLGLKLVREVRTRFPKSLLGKTEPIHFYLSDLDTAVYFDLNRGVVECEERQRAECDLALSSQALWFAFKFPWGFSTLEVSGRYTKINPSLNKNALYLCHLCASDIHFESILKRVLQPRVWGFCWAKRYEVVGRLFDLISRRRIATATSEPRTVS